MPLSPLEVLPFPFGELHLRPLALRSLLAVI